ncbi:MAG: RES domain-containing protein [Desulfobacterales bacterium]
MEHLEQQMRATAGGVRFVYTAASVALATLEVLVNGVHPQQIDNYIRIPVDFPKSVLTTLDLESLSADWKSDPAADSTRTRGRRWAKAALSVVLCVPSVVVDDELSFLINPLHADFGRIHIGRPLPYAFDARPLHNLKTA